jgi:hypothetical protein
MNNLWPFLSCLRIGLVGEPLFHHQTGFDERFEDVPEGWFLDVAGIVLILTENEHNSVYHTSFMITRSTILPCSSSNSQRPIQAKMPSASRLYHIFRPGPPGRGVGPVSNWYCARLMALACSFGSWSSSSSFGCSDLRVQ